MPKIDFKKITEVIPSPDGKLPVNIVLVQKIPGTGDLEAKQRAVRIRSMKDVADLAKPGFAVELRDEGNHAVECTVDYSEGVVSTDDLTSHLNPDWVHEHMSDTQRKALNVQQRLRARQEILAKLYHYLKQHPESIANLPAFITDLTNEQKQLGKHLEELRKLDI